MNRVGVPSTRPEGRPLSTSRWIRSSTVLLARSRSNAATSKPQLGGVPAQVAVLAPSAGGTAARACPRTGHAAQRPQPRPPRRGRAGECGSAGMPEREPHVPPELLFDLLDRIERLPRVRALVIAELDDQATGGRTADVIDFLVQRRQGQLA